MEKRKFKKVLAILCVFAILQSYFVYFANIAIAANEGFFTPGGSNIDETLGGEDEEPEEDGIEEETGEQPEENGDEELGENLETPENIENPNDLENQEDSENQESQENLENPDAQGNTQENSENQEDQEETTSKNEQKEPEEIEPYVDPVVTLEVASENSNIYKGYLYANATSELKYATDYNTIEKLEIVGGKNISKLTVQDEPDKIQLITSTKIGLMNDMYYRKTRVSVDEFKSILGQEGSIAIYTEADELIGYINKDTLVENEEYVFYYEAQYNSVKFELTNILRDGPISIKNDKSIKETSDFSRNQISLFSSINTITALNVYVGEEVRGSSSEGNINLEETESRMELGIDTQDLSVEGKNDVAINVTLRTDEERYDLFENPTIDLEFPSAIESLEVTGMTLLYKNGLTIDNWEVLTNAYGKKVLRINLAGAQLEYTPGAVQEGTTVVAYTSIDVNRLTADTTENLKMTYTNKDTVRKSYSLEGKDSEDISLNFVGRQELVRMTKITNEVGASVVGYDNDVEKIQIEPNLNQKLTITSALVNNYETTLNDVEIIGRIPFVGNKDENGNDLGTNFDSFLVNGILTTGNLTDIYYSEEPDAESNSSSWTLDVQDFSKIKSFKIVLREKTLGKGERLSFEYTLVIPETVGYNAKGYAIYTAYYKIDNQIYTNQSTVGIYTEEKEVELEDIKEEEKQKLAELTIGTQVSQCGKVLGEEDTVYERQILKYTVVVKNTSDIIAENVVLKCNAENANLYYFYTYEYKNAVDEDPIMVGQQEEAIGEYAKDYEEIKVGDLQPGESRTFEYEVIVKSLSEIETNQVFGKIEVSMENQEPKTTETIRNTIQKAKAEIKINFGGSEPIDERHKYTNEDFYFLVYVKNISGESIKNAVITVNLPEEISYRYVTGPTDKDVSIETKKASSGTLLMITIPEMSADDEERLTINTFIEKIDESIFSRKVVITGNIKVDDEKYNSNEYEIELRQTGTTYEYSWTSVASRDVLEHGDNIIYTFKIKNTGGIDITNCSFSEVIPVGLEVENVILITNKGETESAEYNEKTNTLARETSIDVDEEVELKIYTRVNSGLFDRDQETIENKLVVDGGKSFEKFETNVISYAIKNQNVTTYGEWPEPGTSSDKSSQESNNSSTSGKSKSENNQKSNQASNTSTQSKKKTYLITGTAWIDSNQDGIRQVDEKVKEAVVVTLYKANSNGGVDATNAISTTATLSSGMYRFENVEEGNYVIVFDYNSSKYKVTKYQVENAKATENSDVVSKNLTIKGETRTYGVTDVLTVNKSLTSIDIGLVDKTNFDLKLDKEIETVLVKNSGGTRKYNFKNGENARIEIRSKYYKSSVLDITYKFKVTNEGDVPGYVNKVIDYLPDDVEVVLNASPGWYIGQDDNLYYTGLVDEEIGAGEKKEFKLVLRKSLANGEAAKLTNSAEIVEYTNMLGLYDRDSIENNKEEQEDDFGKAILMISVSTGNTKQIIVTALMIIIIAAITTMVIIKLKNTKRIYR